MSEKARNVGEAGTLGGLLAQSARRGGRRTAFIFLEADGSKRTVSFSELDALSNKAAAAFKAAGIGRGDCVALVHRNGLGFVAAYFGLCRLGAAAVPINFMVQKAEELAYMLGDCRAKGVLTQKEFERPLRKARERLPELKHFWLTDAGEASEDFWTFLEKAPAAPPANAEPVSPEDTAAVLYTSGTTGFPKGVMLSHRNMLSNCEGSIEAMGLSSKDVCLCILPMFHTFAWTACTLVPLRLGAPCVVAPAIAPPAPWLKLMGRRGVTVFAAVPQVYAVLAKQATGLKRLLLRWWFFRKVRFCVSGAAPLNPQTARDFNEAIGVPILQGYGLTETSPVATINTDPERLDSVGRPIRDVRVRVVGEDGRDLPAGGEGEICIQGPNVMKGYLGQEEATREAFLEDGWLKSGDVGALDREGFLYIRDRKKDMIIVKGLKVFSAQVEAVLAAHPAVEEAAIIGIPDETGDETIKAYLVLKKGAAADKSELLQFCRQRLDPYKRPRDVEIVESLPKNALQKVLKRVLRQNELEKRKRAAA